MNNIYTNVFEFIQRVTTDQHNNIIITKKNIENIAKEITNLISENDVNIVNIEKNKDADGIIMSLSVKEDHNININISIDIKNTDLFKEFLNSISNASLIHINTMKNLERCIAVFQNLKMPTDIIFLNFENIISVRQINACIGGNSFRTKIRFKNSFLEYDINIAQTQFLIDYLVENGRYDALLDIF